MKKLPLLLLALLVLAACAPAPAKETSDVSQTSEVLPTPTETPTPSIIETPRPTATATALKKTETPSPTATKETATNTAVPMEISAEERKVGEYIEYDYERDVASGKLLAAEKQALETGKVVIDPSAKNYGWVTVKSGSGRTAFVKPMYNLAESHGNHPFTLVSVGILDGKMFDAKYAGRKFALLGFAFKNPDGSVGILHGAYPADGLPSFFRLLKSPERPTIPSFFGDAVVEESDASNSYWYLDPLSQFQGGETYKQGLLEQMVKDGKNAKITPEMESILYFFTFR